jgi:hypothetical protein
MVKANLKQMAKRILTCGSATALTLSLLAPVAPKALAAEITQVTNATETVKLQISLCTILNGCKQIFYII